MAITENDVRLYASERMTDFSDGGGAMSPTVIVDGLDNNVFPDVTDIDRLTGRSSVRKVFGAVVSADTDTYLSAHALIDDAADDSAVDALLFLFGGYTTERLAAANAMGDGARAEPIGDNSGFPVEVGQADSTSGSATITVRVQGTSFSPASLIAAGSLVSLELLPSRVGYLRTVISTSGWTVPFAGYYEGTVVLDAAIPATAVNSSFRKVSFANPRSYGVGVSAAGAPSGASSLAVGTVFARVVPVDVSAPFPVNATSAPWLTAANAYWFSQGRTQVIQPNDALLIHSTIGMTPATYPVSITPVSTGRTNLARLRVIGNNGVEHARFTLGVPAPSGVGCTADLAAGTVTFSDVSGMSQPVTIEHRIEEMALASAVSVGTGVITLNRPLSRDYPAGTKVSSLCMLGDLQGRVIGGFAQSAWTGVFSDTVLGGTPTADFNDAVYPIVTTNQGSVTDRWTIIFTNTTTFRAIGELTGEISGGSTGAAYAPINPATGVPYFTIPALGWGSGWSAGNVYRFNTSGANAPLWLIRTVAPSVPGGSDSVTVEFRGYVNT